MISKKSSGILREENKQVIYIFVDQHKEQFGLRWLLKRCGIYSNGYYNYFKNTKDDYLKSKKEIQSRIKDIFHSTGGIVGHRGMVVFLACEGVFLNKTTVHKYMNKEL